MTIAYDFKIGASVLMAEGEVGRLRSVVVDPESDVVTHLVANAPRRMVFSCTSRARKRLASRSIARSASSLRRRAARLSDRCRFKSIGDWSACMAPPRPWPTKPRPSNSLAQPVE